MIKLIRFISGFTVGAVVVFVALCFGIVVGGDEIENR